MRVLFNLYGQLVVIVDDRENVIPFVRPEPPRAAHALAADRPPAIGGQQQSEVRA